MVLIPNLLDLLGLLSRYPLLRQWLLLFFFLLSALLLAAGALLVEHVLNGLLVVVALEALLLSKVRVKFLLHNTTFSFGFTNQLIIYV